MRVLFCTQAAHTGGGVETWLETLTDGLLACGWDVVTALAKGRFHDPARYASRHRVANPVEIDGSSGLRERRVLELLRVFDRVRPDVIVPVHLADALDAAALWKTRGGTARLAVCIHGQADDRIEQVRRVAPFVDLAASVSRRVAGRLVPVIGDGARVRHIPAGVPPPAAPAKPRDTIRHIAYVGRLDDADKRVRDAVPMIRALAGRDVVFHFAGSGPDAASLQDELRSEIASGRVVFHGALGRGALYETIYPAIDAIVVFSEAETGPIVAWEAMVHGVIPVVSDYVGRREEGVIRDGETGIVFPPGDPESGARAVLRAIDAGRVRDLSLRASAGLPAAYTLHAFHAQWCEALESVVRMPVRSGSRADLPALVSPGFFARFGFGLETTARLRGLLGRRFVHRDPGSEWPH